MAIDPKATKKPLRYPATRQPKVGSPSWMYGGSKKQADKATKKQKENLLNKKYPPRGDGTAGVPAKRK